MEPPHMNYSDYIFLLYVDGGTRKLWEKTGTRHGARFNLFGIEAPKNIQPPLSDASSS